MARDDQKMRDKCGIVGIYGHPQSAHLAYLALYALQHRGQDSAGIVSCLDTGEWFREVGVGLVADVFQEKTLAQLKGNRAIGHVRYTTAGKPNIEDAQPISTRTGNGNLAIAHNGNLINADFLRKKLEAEGAIFHTSSDTEVISHLFARSKKFEPVSCIKEALTKVQGAFSLCVLANGILIGARDPHGIRPLHLGKLSQGYVLASEDCAFSLIGAQPIRELEAGEIVVIDDLGVKSFGQIEEKAKEAAPCIFEHVYFARPDSTIFSKSVHQSRKNMGKLLAEVEPVDADVVIPVPDSGVIAALGYAEQSGIPFDMGLVRNHYVGRTFIEPEQRIRHFGVRLKLSPVTDVIFQKRLVVVDDSIVRGTTSKKIVEILRQAGAKEIHMRIAAPPTLNPCVYGIATPSRQELIAARLSIQEIADFLQVNSLAYLPLPHLYESLFAQKPKKMCDACFSGHYPIQAEH